jgi:hypothetical protein
MTDLLKGDDATEAMYIAGTICSDSSRFDARTLQHIARIVDPKEAKKDDTDSMSRDKLCRWLRARSPMTWASYHTRRGLTGLASKLKLSARSILRSIRYRLNRLVNGSRLMRAVYDSTSFDDFRTRVEAPPADTAERLQKASKSLRGMLQELHALQQAENKFGLFSGVVGAAWFGKLTDKDHAERDALAKSANRLLGLTEQYARTEAQRVMPMHSLEDSVEQLRRDLEALERRLRSAGIAV